MCFSESHLPALEFHLKYTHGKVSFAKDFPIKLNGTAFQSDFRIIAKEITIAVRFFGKRSTRLFYILIKGDEHHIGRSFTSDEITETGTQIVTNSYYRQNLR